MAKKDYSTLSKQILDLIGGKDNITYCAHCFTRLRFDVIDKGLIDIDKIKDLNDVSGAQFSGDQFQVIIGPDVENVYKKICEVGNLKSEEKVKELIKDDVKKSSFKKYFDDVISVITTCVNPIIVVFIVGGFLRLFSTILGPACLNILSTDSSMLVIFRVVSDCCYTYFPIYIAFVSAKKFNANQYLAVLLALVMVHPDITNMALNNTKLKVYGIPVAPVTYQNTFIPTIMITWVLAKVENFFKNIVPAIVRDMLYPLFTILVMLPLVLCVIGPLGALISNFIVLGIDFIRETLGPVSTMLVGGFFPLLIVTGMHNALNQAAFAQWFLVGYDKCIMAASYFMDYQILGLIVACLIKSKKTSTKNMAKNCIKTESIGGISEPSIFNFMLRSKRNIIYVVISGMVAGFYVGITNTYCYTMVNSGLIGVLAYLGGNNINNFINGVIACVLAFLTSFILAMVFKCDVED